jgi:hypothetical protein
MPIPPMVIAGAVKAAPYIISGIGSLMGGRKKNAQENPIERIMNMQFTSNKSIGGFGSSNDSIKGGDRSSTYTFDPRLKSYQDNQLQGLSTMPSFNNLKGSMDSLHQGDNPFYNEASNIRSRSYDTLLGNAGASMFRRGMGSSSVMGTAMGRLARDNANQEYTDVNNSLNAQQQYNSNAQTASFSGLNNLYQYATSGQADALSNRQQMLGGANASMVNTRQQDSPFGNLLGLAGGQMLLGQLGGKGAGGATGGGGGSKLGSVMSAMALQKAGGGLF